LILQTDVRHPRKCISQKQASAGLFNVLCSSATQRTEEGIEGRRHDDGIMDEIILCSIYPRNANQRVYREAYGHKNLYNAEFGSVQISKWHHIKTCRLNI